MKIQVKVDGKERQYIVRDIATKPYKKHWELLVRVIKDIDLPVGEELLILAKGTKESMEEMMEIIKANGISCHEQYLEILKKMT